MRMLRAIFRALILLILMTTYILRFYLLGPIRGINIPRGLRLRMEFCHIFEYVLGLKIIKTGNHDVTEPTLHIINHRSYLDPILVHKYIGGVYVAKSEVSKWPVIGWAISMTGIMWVTRESRESRRATRSSVEEQLKKRV